MLDCPQCEEKRRRIKAPPNVTRIRLYAHSSKCHGCRSYGTGLEEWEHFITKHPEDYALLLLGTEVE
jgi:hypothetical protein